MRGWREYWRCACCGACKRMNFIVLIFDCRLYPGFMEQSAFLDGQAVPE